MLQTIFIILGVFIASVGLIIFMVFCGIPLLKDIVTALLFPPLATISILSLLSLLPDLTEREKQNMHNTQPTHGTNDEQARFLKLHAQLVAEQAQQILASMTSILTSDLQNMHPDTILAVFKSHSGKLERMQNIIYNDLQKFPSPVESTSIIVSDLIPDDSGTLHYNATERPHW